MTLKSSIKIFHEWKNFITPKLYRLLSFFSLSLSLYVLWYHIIHAVSIILNPSLPLNCNKLLSKWTNRFNLLLTVLIDRDGGNRCLTLKNIMNLWGRIHFVNNHDDIVYDLFLPVFHIYIWFPSVYFFISNIRVLSTYCHFPYDHISLEYLLLSFPRRDIYSFFFVILISSLMVL